MPFWKTGIQSWYLRKQYRLVKEDEGIFYIQKSTNKSSEEGNLRKTEIDEKFQGI